MYKNFQSKFSILAEEFTTRWQSGGVLNGDFCIIRKDAFKNEKIKDRGSQFLDKLREYATSQLPLKISCVKTERPETSNSIAGQGDLMTTIWCDIVAENAPGLWSNPITIPLECIDVIQPEGNNWSPDHPEQWKYKSKVQIKPKEVDQTEGSNRNLVTKHIKGEHVKEPKDGRSQVKKPDEYSRKTKKEAVEILKDASELITEAYLNIKKK